MSKSGKNINRSNREAVSLPLDAAVREDRNATMSITFAMA